MENKKTVDQLRRDIAIIKGQLANDNGKTFYFVRYPTSNIRAYRSWLQRTIFAKKMIELELHQALEPTIVRSGDGSMGVMLGGRFYSRDQLAELLRQIDAQTLTRADLFEIEESKRVRYPHYSWNAPEDVPEEEPEPWEDAYYEQRED